MFQPPTTESSRFKQSQSKNELKRASSYRAIQHESASEKHQHLAARNILPPFTACVKVLYVLPSQVYEMNESTSNIFPKQWSQNTIAQFSNALEMFVPLPVSQKLREFHQVLRRRKNIHPNQKQGMIWM